MPDPWGKVQKFPTLDAAREGLTSALVGQLLRNLQVLGINSMKSPVAVDSLVGQRVVAVGGDGAWISVDLQNHRLRIDMQRVGFVRVVPGLGAWSVGSGPMPTVRFVTDAGAVDLAEPSKTKRVAVWIEPT